MKKVEDGDKDGLLRLQVHRKPHIETPNGGLLVRSSSAQIQTLN